MQSLPSQNRVSIALHSCRHSSCTVESCCSHRTPRNRKRNVHLSNTRRTWDSTDLVASWYPQGWECLTTTGPMNSTPCRRANSTHLHFLSRSNSRWGEMGLSVRQGATSLTLCCVNLKEKWRNFRWEIKNHKTLPSISSDLRNKLGFAIKNAHFALLFC